MDILKKSKEIAKETLGKATEVANDINERLEKRKEIRNLLEKMADCEDEIINYLVSMDAEVVNSFPETIRDNISVIKSVRNEIISIQDNDFIEVEVFGGEKYNSEERFCTTCGKEINPTDIYCKYCGALR